MSSQIGDKAQVRKFNFINAEASASIPVGAPMVFKMDGTKDGVRCTLPSSGSAILARSFFAGVNVSANSVGTGAFGTGQCWGFCNAQIAQQTRSASTASWSTAPALSIGQLLTVNTVADVLEPVGTGALTFVTASTTDTLAYQFGTQFVQQAVMAQTAATRAGTASSSNDTRLAVTYSLKVMLRLM